MNPEEDDQDFDITVRRYIHDIEDNEQAINNENDDICNYDSNNSEKYDEYKESDNSAQGDVVINTSDLDNFVKTAHNPNLINKHDDHNIEHRYIPTKNTGEEVFEVINEIPK